MIRRLQYKFLAALLRYLCKRNESEFGYTYCEAGRRVDFTPASHLFVVKTRMGVLMLHERPIPEFLALPRGV